MSPSLPCRHHSHVNIHMVIELAYRAWSGCTVSQPELVLVCRHCKSGLKVAYDRTFKHLSERHGIGRGLEIQLTRYLRSLSLSDPFGVSPRGDGLAPHPHLAVQSGHARRLCGFRTSTEELIRRHFSKSHNLPLNCCDFHDIVFLQCWTLGGPGERP